ncbi:MAG: DUF5592 family protein [Acutalibacteraceae bacterium]
MKDRYIVPQELKSKTQILKKIYFKDLIIILGFFFIMMLFESGVNSFLIIPYRCFNVFVGFVLTARTQVNGEQPIYKSIYFLFISDKAVYHSISQEKEKR